ncbi:hypothetical protein I0C86_20230 [Plantactinospora sp. S1510]|uniref:Uncharacterized protein n=1 Tax=Plantactinospora alkalitolerans TaxID=2789879 RepID=A0ABS0GYG7_9ACTN|nr:hypothetical protein [Plantactinospora alkalitolerans]MBF9131271.1 hypothetical protein [Plantactinospora alkalitolerans]
MSNADPHDVPEPGPQAPATLDLATQLAYELAGTAEVEIERLRWGVGVTVTPTNPDARGFAWSEFAEEIVLQVGEYGGRWELRPVREDLDFLGNVARSVVAGRVREVFARGRSLVEVAMPDGSVEAETGYEGLSGCLPLPLWRRWSRSVQYAPYS